MRISTLVALARSGRLGALLGARRLLTAFQRFCFLGSASSAGLLRALGAGPRSFAVLAGELAPHPDQHDALRDWLQIGVDVGELRREGDAYALAGRLATRLASPQHDALAAFVEEAVGLHHRVVWEAPRRMREGRRFHLADQDGEVIARSSRLLEPVVGEAVDRIVPAEGAVRLLEIGCGSGVYVQRAAARNPRLVATALELQPDVAALARRNLAAWGLSDRVAVEDVDVRRKAPQAVFDLATLHNNIYYFPVVERVALLAHVRRFLVPGGRLLLTTGCTGGTATMSTLSLWGALTDGCGRLPAPAELEAQLREAGFTGVESRSLVPGESYFAFVATSA